MILGALSGKKLVSQSMLTQLDYGHFCLRTVLRACIQIVCVCHVTYSGCGLGFIKCVVSCLAAVLRVHVGEQSGSVKIKVTCTKHIQSYLQENAISFQVSHSAGCMLQQHSNVDI